MKAVIQRVTSASVKFISKLETQNLASVQKIERGLVVLFGVSYEDTEEKIDWMVSKIVDLRIFADKNDKMNLSVKDIKGEILVISQFTLYADCKKGNRPSFTLAAKPEKAEKLYDKFVEELKKTGLEIKTGEFGSMMDVSLVNNGPVTIVLEK